MINWLKEKWEENMFQMIGTIVLIATFGLAIAKETQLAWIALITVGILNLYVTYVRKEITISNWIRGLAGFKIDDGVMIGLIVLCFILSGPVVALWFLLGLLSCHLFEKE